MLQERIKQVFHQRKAIAVGSFVFSFALSLSFVLGIQLKYIGYTWGGVKGKIAIIAVSVILSVIIEPFIYMFTECIEKLKFKKQNLEAGGNRVFFISFIGIFVSWVPHYLAFWPAIMSYDFNAQYVSARSGLDAFTTHHPLMHTFLIRQFLLLGDLLGSPEIGMSLFALTQMVILASIMACSCQLIARITGSNKWGFIGAAFFAIFPTHPIMSVCMTKDVLFSAFFLLFTISMIKLSSRYRSASTSGKRDHAQRFRSPPRESRNDPMSVFSRSSLRPVPYFASPHRLSWKTYQHSGHPSRAIPIASCSSHTAYRDPKPREDRVFRQVSAP